MYHRAWSTSTLICIRGTTPRTPRNMARLTRCRVGGLYLQFYGSLMRSLKWAVCFISTLRYRIYDGRTTMVLSKPQMKSLVREMLIEMSLTSMPASMDCARISYPIRSHAFLLAAFFAAFSSSFFRKVSDVHIGFALKPR